ncbi:two-component system sensor kinase [Micromonospora sp. ATCC 39149]|nr:two-component system sensor kinase [Micromonospora sp. ATCC 39149]
MVDLGLVAIALLDVWIQLGFHNRIGLVGALVACAALMFRRQAPLAVFVATLPAVLLTWAVFANLIALYALAARSRNRKLLAVCVLTSAIFSVLPWPASELDSDFADLSNSTSFLWLLYSLTTSAAPVFLGQLILARRDLAARLDEITESRAHEELLIMQNVLATERAQLAREMHDVVSHQVSLISVRAGALQVSTSDSETRQAAATIRQLSVRTLEELRYMVNVLRASGSRPTDLTPQPTLNQLADLVAGSAVDARLNLGLPAGAELSPPVQRAIYRTVQEGLTNVRKHASGSTALVEICWDDGAIRTTVTNTAPTRPVLPLPSGKHGLAGLRQRAELLGGTLRAEPTDDHGFRLDLRLPANRGG